MVTAATGIHIPNASVNTLQATNTQSGDLVIYNTGSLNLADLTGLGWSLKNEGGGIEIETGNSTTNLTISSPISASGTVHLEADDSIFVNSTITAGGRVTLIGNTSGQDVGQVTGAGLITAPELVVSAAAGINLTTQVGYFEGTNTDFGQIDLVNTGNLVVDHTSSVNQVNITVINGTLNGTTADNLPNITASTIVLSATNGIGTTGALEIDAAGLSASVGGVGSLNIFDTAGGLDVNNATTFNGSIGITAANGTLTLVNVAAGGTGDVALTTLGLGDVRVFTVSAPGHQITINSAGGIFSNGGGTNLTASNIVLSAVGDIGEDPSSEGSPLLIDGITLTATTSTGSMWITDVAGGLHVISAAAPQGAITIITALDSGGDLVVDQASAGDSVILSSDHDLTVTTIAALDQVTLNAVNNLVQTPLSIVTATNEVAMTAGAGIMLGRVVAGSANIAALNGSILDGNDLFGETLNLVVNGDVIISASSNNPLLGKIGTLANCIEVQIGGSLFANASFTPGIATSFCGTTNGGLVTLLPNGVGAFNDVPVDPAYLEGIRGAAFFSWDYRRRFDLIEQLPLIDSAIHIPLPMTDERTSK